MNTVQIGSESEHVKITLGLPFSEEGWCEAYVEIAVPCFHGRIDVWLDAFAIESFASQLKTMYESLQGKACLEPLEGQLTLVLKAKTGGRIQLNGTAWSAATCGNKLEFELELDQSYLPKAMMQLQGVVAVDGQFKNTGQR